MSSPFSHTLRALERDGAGGALGALLATVVVLGLWLVWFFVAEVSVYETTPAQLQAPETTWPVALSRSGRVVRSALEPGAEVRAGQVLVALDARAEELRLKEARARREGVSRQLEALREEIAAQTRGREDVVKAAEAQEREAQARVREARSEERLRKEEVTRARELVELGQAPQVDVERAEASARQQREATQARYWSAYYQRWERQVREDELEARLASLGRERAELEGLLATEEATMERLEHEIAEHTLRAPATGRLAAVVRLQVGAWVGEGAQIGAIVAPGALKIVARVAPGDALGRIQAGQEGLMRLDAFPWTQYGALPATVARVDRELREGRVEVELTPTPGSGLPLQHGQTGQLEIAIERVTPATLVLRALGHLVAPPSPTEGG